ncbi:MAG: hypothetical protein OXI20_01240 [Rhodospirillales bacterium]|nr:hypothetical protein [Rhodospirillales bacterium]
MALTIGVAALARDVRDLQRRPCGRRRVVGMGQRSSPWAGRGNSTRSRGDGVALVLS